MKPLTLNCRGKYSIFVFMNRFIDLNNIHHLSITERAQIEALRACGMSYRKIAATLKVTRSQVGRFLTSKSFNRTKETRGRKRILTKRNHRSMKRIAVNDLMTAKTIKTTLDLQASVSTIQRSLKRDVLLVYKKIASKPTLTKGHKSKRVNWAMQHLDFGTD